MRSIKKYKKFAFYNKRLANHSLFSEIPSKILNFKKPKWESFKILKNKKKKLAINSVDYKVKSYKMGWSRLKSSFKDSLIVKNNINNSFDHNFKSSFWKKSLRIKRSFMKNSLFSSFLVLPEFRVNVFLWRLQVFNSTFEASQALQNELVLVNNKQVSKNYFLKKGDVISLKKEVLLNKTPEFSKILPFFEYDYYSKTFVIVLNWQDISPKDSYLFVNEFFDLKAFKSFL